MSIAFTTSPTDTDWDVTLQGWRCTVLKIPGAEINALFTPTGRIDKAWYEVLSDLNVVRWVHDSSPPAKVAFSVLLTQELSTQELTAKWKKLAIVLPVAASVIVGLLSALGPGKSEKTSVKAAHTPYHIWTVSGKVKPTAAFAYYDVTPTITPPDLRLKADWTFEGKLPIEYSDSGHLDFPSIVMTLDKPGYITPVVHLANPGDPPPGPNEEDYGQWIDSANHIVKLTRAIEFHTASTATPFQPVQQAVPASSPPTTALSPSGG